jgi:hypothetical protein
MDKTKSEQVVERELTEAEVEKIDRINNVAHNAMCELLGDDVEWNMEWIGEISDVLADIAIRFFKADEVVVYPYIREEAKDEEVERRR